MKLHAVVKVYENKGQTKVEVPFCSDDVSAVQKEQKRLLVVRAPGTIITTGEVGSWQLSKAGMLEVSDAYDQSCLSNPRIYPWVRQTLIQNLHLWMLYVITYTRNTGEQIQPFR